LSFSAGLWDGAGMKRICVIGDSSAAALKAGWDQTGGRFPDVALTFFAAPGKMIDGLVVEDGKLAASSDVLREQMIKRSGGLDRIDPAAFDAYVLSGMQLDAVYVGRLRADFPGRPVTDDVVIDAAVVRLADTIHGRTVRRIRQCTQSPLAMLTKPCRVIDPQKAFWEQLHRRDVGRKMMELFGFAAERFARQMRCAFIAQPPETIGESGIDTRPEFARNSARFFENADDDLSHMNGDYGAIVLRRALAALN
jgi:hypothetical protein